MSYNQRELDIHLWWGQFRCIFKNYCAIEGSMNYSRQVAKGDESKHDM